MSDVSKQRKATALGAVIIGLAFANGVFAMRGFWAGVFALTLYVGYLAFLAARILVDER